MDISQTITPCPCNPSPSGKDPSPIFKNEEEIKQAPKTTAKACFELNLNQSAAPFSHTTTGARRLSSFTIRKGNSINYRLITHTTPYPSAIIEQFLRMPEGINKNEILATLAHLESLDDVSKVKCIFAMSRPQPAPGQNLEEFFDLKYYCIRHTFTDTIHAFAQNSTLDPDLRAECILHMVNKKQQAQLSKGLLKQEPSCSKELQVKLAFLLKKRKFKEETLKRLAQDQALETHLRNILIFTFPEGKVRDRLLEALIGTPGITLDHQVAPAAFIHNPAQRNYHLIRILDDPEASLEARCNCAILLDKKQEKYHYTAQLNQTPEGKAYLEKTNKLLKQYYPMVEDVHDLSLNAKFPALYPGCTQDPNYLSFLNNHYASS